MLARFVPLVCAVLILVGSSPPTARGAEGAPLDQGSARADAVVAGLRRSVPELMKAADVPGVAVAVVHGGELVWSSGFGVRNAETVARVDDSTVFEAASLTKPVVAFGALRLVEAGKLDLDKPLAT
jgi:CubicO group peptidase (beta-lactamase class C family)